MWWIAVGFGVALVLAVSYFYSKSNQQGVVDKMGDASERTVNLILLLMAGIPTLLVAVKKLFTSQPQQTAQGQQQVDQDEQRRKRTLAHWVNLVWILVSIWGVLSFIGMIFGVRSIERGGIGTDVFLVLPFLLFLSYLIWSGSYRVPNDREQIVNVFGLRWKSWGTGYHFLFRPMMDASKTDWVSLKEVPLPKFRLGISVALVDTIVTLFLEVTVKAIRGRAETILFGVEGGTAVLFNDLAPRTIQQGVQAFVKPKSLVEMEGLRNADIAQQLTQSVQQNNNVTQPPTPSQLKGTLESLGLGLGKCIMGDIQESPAIRTLRDEGVRLEALAQLVWKTAKQYAGMGYETDTNILGDPTKFERVQGQLDAAREFVLKDMLFAKADELRILSPDFLVGLAGMTPRRQGQRQRP